MVVLGQANNITNVEIVSAIGAPSCQCMAIAAIYLRSNSKLSIGHSILNGNGIRDTARVLRISPTTVIEESKKDRHLKAINEARLAETEPTQTIVQLCQWQDVEAGLGEMWSFVQSK